jgi:hypothetical protein
MFFAFTTIRPLHPRQKTNHNQSPFIRFAGNQKIVSFNYGILLKIINLHLHPCARVWQRKSNLNKYNKNYVWADVTKNVYGKLFRISTFSLCHHHKSILNETTKLKQQSAWL